MITVLPGVILSDWKAAHDEEELKRHRVRFVLNISTGENDHDDMKLYRDLKIVSKSYNMTEEDYPLEERLDKKQILACWNTIFNDMMVIRGRGQIEKDTEKNKPVILVHCVAGRNRSVAALVYYRMRLLKEDYMEACNEMKRLRPEMDLDTTFIDLLIEQNSKKNVK